MNLSSLQKTTTKKKKRIGLGHGSGRGKTSGRGTKGQKARGDIPLIFQGGPMKSSLIKRLPFLRGKGRNKPFKKKSFVINVSALNVFSKGQIVDMESLVKQKMVDLDFAKPGTGQNPAKQNGVKILGDGELGVALTVKVPVSKGAKKKIEKAGGTIE